jgi:hypothetical protein
MTTNNKLLKSKPKWSGRFGNNITQLINIITLGLYHQSYVYIDSLSGYKIKYNQILDCIHRKIITDKNTIIDLENSLKHQYIINPYFLGHSKFFRTNIDYNQKIASRYYINDILKQNDDNFTFLFSDHISHIIDEKALYIHIRSSDIYNGSKGSNVYAQPPLSFYIKVIEDHQFRKIYILSDNNNSFLVKNLKNIYGNNCAILNANARDSFDILCRCKHICTSTSSFCTTAIFLSPENIYKNVYTYSYLTNIFHHWFLSDLFETKNIKNNNISNIKFNIYSIKNYPYMKNCSNNYDLYKDIGNPLWWKNGNENFKFNWKFDNDTKNIMLNYNTKDVLKML